ncbi:1,3-beta-glucanosyltransferase [Teratosphaeriaceae sp. CCFEE 6253]|nr:1,3-beta-glucanosyltransferase [Teratosphaeriaceae sp. CCFEE 6253]
MKFRAIKARSGEVHANAAGLLAHWRLSCPLKVGASPSITAAMSAKHSNMPDELLLDHLPPPTPANIPITTQGNFFYRDGERFLIKGVSYIPYSPTDKHILVDPLCDAWLPELQKDIPLLRHLGLNSISIRAADASNNHAQAMALLASQGIYVLVTIFQHLQPPPAAPSHMSSFKPHSHHYPFYDPRTLAENLPLLDELAVHPNLLGFVVDAGRVNNVAATRLAPALRACIRDSKAFLRARRHRLIPVGIQASDIQQLRLPQLAYFTAGLPSLRADFFALDSYSWCGPSSFRVSGWEHLVVALARTAPIPVLLAEYGSNTRRPRVWDEVLCLYSPDMTGVVSGGFVYTLLESGNAYGLLKVGADGRRVRTKDYEGLRKRFGEVGRRTMGEVTGFAEERDYESWVGEFPECDSRWLATEDVPPFPAEWKEVMAWFAADSDESHPAIEEPT